MKLTEEHIVDVYNKLHKELVDSMLSENNDVRNILNDEEFVQRLSRHIETKDMLIYLIFEDGWEYLEKADVPDPEEFFIKLSQDNRLMNSWNNPDLKWDDIYYDVDSVFVDCFDKKLY